MGVDPAALPNAGAQWRTTRYNDDDYRPNDCLWNAAWNQLRAEGAGGPPPRDSEVQTRVNKLVQDYGIRDPDVVTKAQLDRIAQDNYGKSSQQGYSKMVHNANTQANKADADGMRGRIADGYVTQLATKPGAENQSATSLNANFVTIMTNHTDKDWNTDWTAVGKDIATLAKSNPALAKEMSTRAFTLMGRPTSLLHPPLIKETFSDPGQVHAQIATGMAQNLNGDQLKALSPDVLKQMDAALPAGAEKTKVEQALGLLPPAASGSSYTPGAQGSTTSTTKIAVYGTPNGSGQGSGVYYTTDDALSIGGICVKDPFNTPGYVPLDPNNRHSSLARPASAQEYANFKSLYPS